MGNFIKPHLDNAEKTGICQLIDMDVMEWPPDLDKLKLTKNLRILDLSKNQLTHIPAGIAQYKALKKITMKHNRVCSISDEAVGLKKLETFILDYNKLTTLPQCVNSWSRLKMISLKGNMLREFPLGLCGLKHLEEVDLSHNQLTNLPEGLEKLEAVELSLDQNRLKNLSSSLAKCPRLKVLRLEDNCLSLSSFTKELLSDSKIELLEVEGNIFTMEEFSELEGYCQYMERYVANKKKISGQPSVGKSGEMGNSIKPHLENAEKTGVCQLIDMSLKEWPPDLRKLAKNLRTLDLSKNQITIIPAEISIFNVLKNLTMTHNRVNNINEEIGKLKKLETLVLDFNVLSTLPKSINSLSHLRTISLSGNRFREFPLELCGLKHLELVNLSRNHLTTVPQGVDKLDVVELNLDQNQISDLPASLSKCPRLKVLRAEENCLSLTSFPRELLVDSKIVLFAVEGNVFSAKQFSELDGHDQYMERYTATKKKI